MNMCVVAFECIRLMLFSVKQSFLLAFQKDEEENEKKKMEKGKINTRKNGLHLHFVFGLHFALFSLHTVLGTCMKRQ